MLSVTVAATAISAAALSHLAVTDPKRRRVFHLPAPRRRHAGAAWAAAFAPGVVVAEVSGAGGLLVWFGAISVLGWAVARARPHPESRLAGTVGNSDPL